MVVIRLTRFGGKKKPYYRIVAVDREKPRESRYIELLGQYNPLTDPAQIKIDLEKYNQWIQQGSPAIRNGQIAGEETKYREARRAT